MARYMKPTFLRWPCDIVEILFGKSVFETWTKECQAAGLELGAVLGRPLYVCTRKLPGGEVCGAMAAMSPLMEQHQKHKEFVCKACAESCASRKDQALPVLRLVRLYAQVRVDDRLLAMRSAPMHILIHAPKDDSTWGIRHQAPPELHTTTAACPGKVQIVDHDGFSYSYWESHHIWEYASHFQDATCGTVS